MPILAVSGSSGFVGNALCSELLSRGHAVRRIVRRAKGSLPSSPLSNDEVLEVPVGDIGPDTDWTNALAQIDCVVHLAARVHIMKDNAKDPLAEFLRINTAATEHLARCAAQAGVRRLVFLSTINVNGTKTMGVPFTEVAPARPSNPYGVSKWKAEKVLLQIARETGIEIVILRSPLIYGLGARGKFPMLVKAIMRGAPLPLASVANKRSLLYLGNAVDALILAALHPDAAGKTFLLSDGQDVSTPELIRRLAADLGVPARLVHCPLSLLRLAGRLLGKVDSVSGLIDSLQIDSSAIRRELGWAPLFSVEQGLHAAAQWYRNQHL